mgnify:CR=1 FL=1
MNRKKEVGNRTFVAVSVVVVAVVVGLWLKFFGLMANLPATDSASASAPSVDAARGSQALIAAVKNAFSSLLAPKEIKVKSGGQ